MRKNLADPNVRYQYGNWLTTSFTYRLGLFARRRWNRQTLASQGPSQQQLQSTFDATTAYYTLVFEDLVHHCREKGYRPDVVFINTGAAEPAWKWETEHVQDFVAELCHRNQVHFCSTKSVLADRPELTLPLTAT